MGERRWNSTYKWDAVLSNDEAIGLICHILDHGRTIFSDHAFERMEERKFTIQDVEAILENGRVIEQEFDKTRKNWKYKVSGKTIDHEQGVVISAVLSDREQMIITVC